LLLPELVIGNPAAAVDVVIVRLESFRNERAGDDAEHEKSKEI
jgi:hypothetical protein